MTRLFHQRIDVFQDDNARIHRVQMYEYYIYIYLQEQSIETPHGFLHVTLHGSRSSRRPAILTFHDVGLDSKSCFLTLFKFEEMQEIVKNFTLIHIDAPGQEEGAAAYPAKYDRKLPVCSPNTTKT
uniref:Protein NDRG3 n=1 Tax=Neogobius melanostomus TaxID=47308 RepID=A0A8C6SHA0_9GOBI